MQNTNTLAGLFDLAAQAEYNAEKLYRALARMFAPYEDVAQFWNRYAEEEVSHAKWLMNRKTQLPAELLAQPADPDIWQLAWRVNQVSIERILEGIHDLQEAYEIANEIEHAETNAVFEFLIGHFSEDAQTQAFLRSQLNDHVSRLMIAFPSRFHMPIVRRTVKAAKG